MKTITELEKYLKELRKNKAYRQDGMFGIVECKKVIKCYMKYKHITEIYCEFITRALTETGFNELMIVACEEMMEELK